MDGGSFGQNQGAPMSNNQGGQQQAPAQAPAQAQAQPAQNFDNFDDDIPF